MGTTNTSHQLSDSFDQLNVGSCDGEPEIEGPWIDQTDNPMLNDLILESLFNYIHGNDLKTCRLVCRKWTVLTTPLSRSRLRVTIWGTDSNKSEQSRGIVNFVKLIESNTLGIPFGRFRLGSFDTRTGPGQRFLELCGSIAKEFWLDRSTDHVAENISALLRSAPKLDSFVMPPDFKSRGGDVVQLFPVQENGEKPKLNFLKSLDASHECPQNRKTICPTFYKELFGAAEQISTLNLPTHNENVLATLVTLGNATKIENLKIGEVTDTHLKILKNIAKNLKLRKLDLTVIRSPGRDLRVDWFEVVKLFKNTLTCLHMDVMTCNSISLTFPCMPNLKQLKLKIPDSRDVQPLWCENRNFSTTFPVLEKLQILSFGLLQNLFIDFTTSEEPLKTMKSLILQHGMTVEMETLNHILKIFPNLTTFECQIHYNHVHGTEVIQNIWSHMTQLERLKISGHVLYSESLDSLLTGIPDKDLRRMRKVIESLGEKTTTMDSRQGIISAHAIASRPSIQNLTALRSLNIGLMGEGGKELMTDLTGFLGFYSLKNLRHLSVSHCDISKICSEILVRDKELLSWRFMKKSDQEIIPSNWKYNSES